MSQTSTTVQLTSTARVIQAAGPFNKRLLYLLGCFVLLARLVSARPARAITLTKIDAGHLPADCYVTNWSLLGPFVVTPGSDSAAAIKTAEQHDYLSDLGYRDSNITVHDLKRLAKVNELYKSYAANSAIVNLNNLYPRTSDAVVYAVAVLHSDKNEEIGVEIGSQDALTLSVNGEPILASGGSANAAAHVAIAYDHYGVAQLHRGSNILVAKIDRKPDGGSFLLSFADADHIKQVIATTSSGNILHAILLRSGDPLRITIPPACVQPSMAVEVRDIAEKARFSVVGSYKEMATIELPHLPDGYYFMTASSRCGTVNDSFYLGDPSTVHNDVIRLRDSNAVTSRAYLGLDAIAQRYEILTSNTYSHPTDRSWQMKLRMIIKDGVHAVQDPHSLQWANQPGLHLREYISAIDGAREPYLICVPDSYGSPVPLVVTLPPLLGTGRPFLEGAFLSSMNDLEGLERAANDSHALVVRFGNRGNLQDAPMADAQFFEVLADVEHDFNIDKRRIYLLGYSESGRRALLLGEHYPSLFAGIATYGALTGAYDGDESHAKWAEVNNISSMMRNLDNTATIIVNGDRDETSSLKDAEKLNEELVANGVSSSFHLLHYGVHIQPNTESIMIPLLMGHIASQAPNIDYTFSDITHFVDNWIEIEGRGDRQLPMKISASRDGANISITSNNINRLCIDFDRLTYPMGHAIRVVWNGRSTTAQAEAGCTQLQSGASIGPNGINTTSDHTLAEALSEPFLIVLGTGLNSEDSPKTRGEAFISKWKEEFFTTPRIKQDTDLTLDDIQQFNLVVIGNPATDSRLSPLVGLISRIGPEVLSSMGTEFAGSMQEVSVLANPLNLKRSVVFLEVTSDFLNSSEFDPVFNGFYDYGVWDSTGARIKTGIFSSAEVDSLLSGFAEARPKTVDAAVHTLQ